VLDAGRVRFHLVKVLFTSRLDLGLFDIKVGTDLDQGHLTDPGLLLLCSEGFLPSGQLLLLSKQLLLQLLHRCHRRHQLHHSRRSRGRPAYNKRQ
jgi:hypothetical protein